MTEPTKEFLKEAIAYLSPIIKQAGEMAAGSWLNIKIAKFKDQRDVATKTEIEIENFLKKKILSKWPEHGFYGEDTRRINASSDFQWLIDPIDGTKYYVNRAPFFYVHVALLFKNNPVLGFVYNPISGQLFHALKGNGAYLNSEKILLKSAVSIDKAIIDADPGGLLVRGASEKEWIMGKLCRLMEKSYRVRMSGGSLGIYLVTGAIDAYVDLGGPKPQDLAARIIIMREAGCKAEYIETPFGKRLLASREPLFSELKKILSKQ